MGKKRSLRQQIVLLISHNNKVAPLNASKPP
jgi:hypothetical protein